MTPTVGYLLLWAIAPPILACVWYALATGWLAVVHVGRIPESWCRRKRSGFKYMLFGLYAVFFVVGLAKGIL